MATRRAIGAAAGFELLKAEGSIRKRKETRFHELSTREGVKGKPESKEQPRFSSNLSASSPKLGQRMTTSITNKVVVMLQYKGARALDELVGSNRGKIRLISRADEKKYKKGKRNGSLYSEQNELTSYTKWQSRKRETQR